VTLGFVPIEPVRFSNISEKFASEKVYFKLELKELKILSCFKLLSRHNLKQQLKELKKKTRVLSAKRNT